MNFFEMSLERQSCRKYLPQKVEREKLVKIIQTAQNSPSACNSQPWKFVVLDDEDVVSKFIPTLQTHGINAFCDNVKAFVVVCETDAFLINNPEPNQKYAQIDIGLCIANITYAALELGLGTCIIGSVDEDNVKALLNIPKAINIRLVVAIGYPENDTIRKKTRKTFDDVCSFNQW